MFISKKNVKILFPEKFMALDEYSFCPTIMMCTVFFCLFKLTFSYKIMYKFSYIMGLLLTDNDMISYILIFLYISYFKKQRVNIKMNPLSFAKQNIEHA